MCTFGVALVVISENFTSNRQSICETEKKTNKQLTCPDKEEERIFPGHQTVLPGRVSHNKHTVVAIRVAALQARDGQVESASARVSAHTDAPFVLIGTGAEFGAGEHEEHIGGMQPAALQIHPQRLGVTLLGCTGKLHGFPLLPLQELNFTAHLKKGNICKEAQV